MLSLNQRLSQQQKLSPQQIQYQKLLQLNTLALEQRIKTELELNPILEETLMDELEMSLDQKEEKDSDEAEEVKDADNEEFDVEDYMNDEDFEVTKSNKSPDDENIQPIAPSRISLRELIVEQLHMLPLTEEQMIMGETIISSLDISGYFQQDLEKLVSDLKLFDHVEISLEDAEKVLHSIQNLEPVGIAARSLQECLLIQLRNGSY